jgi:hypothetical protein
VFRGGLCGFSAAGGQIEDLLVGARFGDLDVQFRLVRLDYQRHALRSPEFFVEAALGNFQVLLKPGFPPAPSKEPGSSQKCGCQEDSAATYWAKYISLDCPFRIPDLQLYIQTPSLGFHNFSILGDSNSPEDSRPSSLS